MRSKFTFVELFACMAILAAFFGGSDLSQTRAFSIVELLVFGFVAGVMVFMCIGLGYAFVNLRKTTKNVVKGDWLSRPGVIPSAPQSATLVYHVTLRNESSGKILGNVAGQSVSFTLTPVGPSRGSVTIVSVTDAAGQTMAVGGLTATGTTDAAGLITVIVSFEQWQSGTMMAADTKTGATEPSDTFLTTAH
jgi:hypothetical protein